MDWLNRFVPAHSWGAVLVFVLSGCGSGSTGLGEDCPGEGGVPFVLEGGLESADAPFRVADAIEGCIRIAVDADSPGSESTARSDVRGFRVTIGAESWQGNGFSLAGQAPAGLRGGGIRFSVDSSGTALTLHFAEGGRPSSPGGHHLTVTTSGTSTPRFQVWSGTDPYPELAAGTMLFAR